MNVFDAYDPQSARLRFSLRPVLNWLLGLFIFLFVALVFGSALLDVMTGIVLVVLVFGYLNSRSIRLKCPACGKVILSSTPWVCKACDTVNRNTYKYSFLSKCQHCEDEPKAYRCHHKQCGEMIFLTEDDDETNYASCLNSPHEMPEPEPPDERAEKLKTDAEKIREKKHKIEMAELDEKLKNIRERMKGPKVKTPFEQKKESFDSYYESVMGMREYARKKRAEAEEMYKNDPDSLQDAYDAIDEFLRRHA